MKTFSEKLWEKTGLTFWCDWLQGRRCNWFSFNFIHFYVEYDLYANEFNLELGLLGFNMRWQKSLDKWIETKQHTKLLKQVKGLKKK
jgi:hypothetical protein